MNIRHAEPSDHARVAVHQASPTPVEGYDGSGESRVLLARAL